MSNRRTMARSPWRALTMTALALAVVCSDPTGPRSDLLAVKVGDGALTLTNLASDPVFYHVSERDFLAVSLIAICRDPESDCARVPPRGQIVVPFSKIAGFHAGAREAVVLHWRLVSSPDGFAPDSVRAMVTPLR
jgi:hypothetical protein